MKKFIAVFVLLYAGCALARDKNLVPVKVEVVTESQGFYGQYQAPGLGGAIAGSRTFATANLTRAIINGDHALLRCYEHHKGCNSLGAGIYDAEMKTHPAKLEKTGLLSAPKQSEDFLSQPELWIMYVRPVGSRGIPRTLESKRKLVNHSGFCGRNPLRRESCVRDVGR